MTVKIYLQLFYSANVFNDIISLLIVYDELKIIFRVQEIMHPYFMRVSI